MKIDIIKSKKLILSLVLICGIVVIIVKAYAEGELKLRGVLYNNFTYNYYTDSIKFHSHANGYGIMKDMVCPNNYYTYREIGPGIYNNPSETIKAKGYGNYVFNDETNLYKFLEYCHSKNPSATEQSCIVNGINEAKSSTYTKLLGYTGHSLDKDAKGFMNAFWTNMTILLQDVFYQYQDQYYFEKYIVKGLDKTGMSLGRLRQAQNDEDDELSAKEYLTCLSSYMYALTPVAAPDTFTVGRGDVVPFLYYKRNVEETNPKELARFAYVSLIEGWCDSLSGTNLWESEYEEMYGSYDPDDYDLEELKVWYDETYQKYCQEKGRKGNNLLGSDISVIIKSDYSIADQLEATDDYLTRTFAELGIERSYKENIARNQMMAEYMMQDSRLDETIKDYNVSIKFLEENLQRGTFESKNTNTAVLSDYQFITFNHPLNVDGHSDNDTISDLTELTNNYKWMDITAFIEKTYNHMKLNGKAVKSTLNEQIDDIIYKNGYSDQVVNSGHIKKEVDSYGKVRVYYRTYDYSSNPILEDTDYDGIRDDVDSKKLDNKFSGRSEDIGKVEYHNDFRWFFTNPSKYNDELAVMSLIMSNLCDGRLISLKQLTLSHDIESFMMCLGFDGINNKRNIRINSNIDLNANVYIGHKEVDYYGKKKIIYGVFIGNLDHKNAYRRLLANHKDEEISNYYENIAIDIIAFINNHQVDTSNEICYWVSGKGLSGAVANIVAKRLTENGNETFCYTFGAPQNNVSGNGAYSNIKNIINEDDLIPKLLKSNSRFSKYGEIYNGSIKYDNMRAYIDLFGTSSYQGDYKITNNISKEYKELRKNLEEDYFYDHLSQYLDSGSRMWQDEFVNTQYIGSQLDKHKKDVFDSKSTKAYYTLAKNLNGFDKDNHGGSYNETIKEPGSSESEIIAKDIVVGNGTIDRPYYSDTQEISIDTKEDVVWCKFYIDGATDIAYDISSNFNCVLYNRYDNINLYERRHYSGSGQDLIYKNTEINNGENEYLVRIERNNIISNHNNNIKLKFTQHQDILRDIRGAKWVALSDSVKSNKVEFYDTLYYINKDVAPIIIKDEFSDNSILINQREQFIANVFRLVEIIETIININDIRLGNLPQSNEEIMRYVVENQCESSLTDIIKNRYSADGYRERLISESGYYVPATITDDVSKVIGLCRYGLVIKEQESTLLESIILMLKLKDCERWEGITAYGLTGTVGRWGDE